MNKLILIAALGACAAQDRVMPDAGVSYDWGDPCEPSTANGSLECNHTEGTAIYGGICVPEVNEQGLTVGQCRPDCGFTPYGVYTQCPEYTHWNNVTINGSNWCYCTNDNGAP